MFRKSFARVLCAVVAVAAPGCAAANSSVAEAPSAPQLNAPPLFAVAGQSRTVTAIAGGNPITVSLNIRAPQQTTTVPVLMHRTEDDYWQAAIPSSLVRAPAVIYSVTSTYTGTSLSSETARLVVLDTIRASQPELTETVGETLARLELGTDVGVRGGDESARELPASFAVDPSTGDLLVLDSVNARLVTVNPAGKIAGKLALASGTTTASDVVVDRATGTAYVLDQTQDAVIAVAKNGQSVVTAVGTRNDASGARLAQASGTTYFRVAQQGRFVPLLDRGRRVNSSDRQARTHDGLPTSGGDLAAEVDGNSVALGLAGSNPRGFRVNFDEQVLDVSETLADDDGVLWALVGVAEGEGAAAYLVRVDPQDASSRMTVVGASVPGDVTRRLASAGRGVVLLESVGSALNYVRFEAL